MASDGSLTNNENLVLALNYTNIEFEPIFEKRPSLETSPKLDDSNFYLRIEDM